MKAYANVTCGVLLPRDLTLPSDGTRLFRILDRFAWAIPNAIGNSEPVLGQFLSPKQALSHWRSPFLWKNNLSKAEGSAWFGHKKAHSCIFLHFEPGNSNVQEDELTRLLIELSDEFNADLGYVHLTTDHEMADSAIPYDHSYAVDTGLTTHDLLKGIPKLCWAMIFGPRYSPVSQRFNDATIEGVLIKHTSEGQHTFVQLTPHLNDLSTDYPGFNNKRDKVMQIIGNDFLRSSNGGPARWRPSFEF